MKSLNRPMNLNYRRWDIDMKYASVVDRFLAYLMDYLIIIIPLFIGVSFIMITYFKEYTDGQAYPFILLILLVFPVYMFGYLFMYQTTDNIKIIFLSVIVIFIVESCLLILMELMGGGCTTGENKYKIKVTMSDNTKYTIGRRVCRALLKSISRNIIFIPCISIIFTIRRQSVYDILLRTIVIKNIEY